MRRGLAAGGLLFIINAWAAAEVPALTAPERPFRAITGSDPAIESTYDRAEELLRSGYVQQAAEQFAVVAKLAGEPMRSRAILKFGYASSILNRPGAQSALAAAALTTVGGAEGREIQAFAQAVMQQTPVELLVAPPRGLPKSAPRAGLDMTKSLWTQIDEIEMLRQKGRWSDAAVRYRALLKSFPDHPVLLNNMALLLAEVDDVEAESLIRRAFTTPGADQYVDYLYDTLGVALLKQGRAVESIDHFRRALAMRETAERDLHMAMALETIGQPDAAEQYRARAGALDATGQLAGM